MFTNTCANKFMYSTVYCTVFDSIMILYAMHKIYFNCNYLFRRVFEIFAPKISDSFFKNVLFHCPSLETIYRILGLADNNDMGTFLWHPA
jgi:hypothetical protein